MKTLALAVVVAMATAACDRVETGERCNHEGEHRLQDKRTFRCDVSPGEFHKNVFGKKFQTYRWKELQVR